MNDIVNICMVHYRHPEDTIECITCLSRQTVAVRIWVIGNGTPEQEWNYLQAHATSTDLNWIYNAENIGFARANNVLLGLIQKQYIGEDILFINNDTWVPTDFVESLQKAHRRLSDELHTPIALSATEIGYHDGQFHHTGMQYISHLTGLVYSHSGLFRHSYLCGACIYVSSNAPMWASQYFLYFEDADYAYRLRNAHFRLVSTDATYYKHKVGASTNHRDAHFTHVQFESMLHYFQANSPYTIPIVFVLRSIEYLFRRDWDTLKTLYTVWIKHLFSREKNAL